MFYRAARPSCLGRDLAMLTLRRMHEEAAGMPLTLVDDDGFRG
jgi:hypothetical protein